MEIKNFHMYQRYNKFIESRPKRPYSIGLEKHHIIPLCIGGEDNKQNIVNLTPKEHYLAHWMLAKIYGNKLWFAFNMMRRVIPGKIKTSHLYFLARKYISEQISKSNKGKKHDEKFKKDISERTKNTVIVKTNLKSNTYFRVNVNDEEYLNGNLIYYRVGYIHNEKTKEKMSENGIKNKKAYFNTDSDKIEYHLDNPGKNYIKGNPNQSKIASERFKGDKIYYNIKTGETIRTKDEILSEDYIKGRKVEHYISGLNYMNNPDYRRIYNLKDKKHRYILKNEKLIEWDVNHSSFTHLVIFDNFIFESIECFSFYLQDFPIIHKNKLDKKFIPHHNQNKKNYNFCLIYKGLSYKNLGFYLVKISEYTLNTNSILIRRPDGEFKINDFRRAFEEKTRI